MSTDTIEVLVVDDDVDYCVQLGMFLTRHSEVRYHPTLCHSGAHAVELCKIERYDCVLMDYRLGDMTGTEVIVKLRDSLGEKMAPVIMMSGNGLEDAAIEALRVRATDLLLKENLNQQSVGRAVTNAVIQGQLQRGIQERSTELMMANIELERRASEIQRFYHAVSHEMKTPLTATREFVSIVVDGILGPVNEKQMHVLKDALICCDQITTQFNDLIDLTRMETGKLSLNIVPSHVEPLLNRAIAISKKSALEKGITLEYSEAEHLPDVQMDEGRVSQVVNNLLNNAIKFTESGGTIRLSVRQKHRDYIQIRVTDTGCGIPKAYLTDIFNRLFQVEMGHSANIESGLGLGLSVAREIVRGHGSQLMVRSRLGVGSSFHFNLQVNAQGSKFLNNQNPKLKYAS